MADPIWHVNSPTEIAAAAERLRAHALSHPITPLRVMDILEQWGSALRGPAVDRIPGVAFLRLWLRRGSLEPILQRELGPAALRCDWHQDGHARLGIFPLGVVGHWPAGNIEIQP